METIKKQFKEQYNKSIEFFNKEDYEHYFFHVRKSIELFGKYLIFDTFALKGNTEVAGKIINGSYSFKVDHEKKMCTLLNTPMDREPEGSFFISLAKWTFYYAFPSLFNPGSFPRAKRIKVKIDSCLDSLINYYNTSSEIVMHTADSLLDQRTQAKSCAAFFVKAFNDLKSQISEDATLFLNQLDLPQENEKNINANIEKALIRNNAFSVIDEITNNFTSSSDDYYVALLPERLEDNYGKLIGTNQLQSFFRLNWQFVVDFNKKTEDGLYAQAPINKKSSIRIITDNISK